MLLLLLITTALEIKAITYLSFKKAENTTTNVTEIKVEHNKTLCIFIRQMKLSEKKRVTVCNYHNNIRVDIRQFVKNSASIKGIWLTKDEWKSLTDSTWWVNNAIHAATSLAG